VNHPVPYVQRYNAVLELFLLVLMKIGLTLSRAFFEPSFMSQIHWYFH